MEKTCPECNGRIDFYGSSRQHRNVWLYACHKCNILWRLGIISENPRKMAKRSELGIFQN